MNPPDTNHLSPTIRAALFGGGTLSIWQPVAGAAIGRAVMTWPNDDRMEGEIAPGLKSMLDSLETFLAREEQLNAQTVQSNNE